MHFVNNGANRTFLLLPSHTVRAIIYMHLVLASNAAADLYKLYLKMHSVLPCLTYLWHSHATPLGSAARSAKARCLCLITLNLGLVILGTSLPPALVDIVLVITLTVGGRFDGADSPFLALRLAVAGVRLRVDSDSGFGLSGWCVWRLT